MRVKPKTRDNLIYLAVGVSIVALLVADIFYADSHGHNFVNISNFEFRAASAMLLVGYFMFRAARTLRANSGELCLSVAAAALLSVLTCFVFRQSVEELPGLLYSSLTALEILLIVELVKWGLLYFRRMPHSG
jgi:hypothetical protein